MAGTSLTSSNIDNLSVTTQEKDIEVGTNVLQQEAEALSILAVGLDMNFSHAIETIDRMKSHRRGRLIITGMGKSGHIGRKITATLASTGTPALFVHPGEASHGDLGMITEDDVVIALSNSGEAPELSDIIAFTRRFGIPLIGMTREPESTLGKASDILLQTPNVPEACPNGLAPTTSTTMMMALGDAIAIALLERIGLTSEQFKAFHPGGKLGKKLMSVSELMVNPKDLPIASADTKMSEAIITMTEKNLGSLLVTEGDTLLGIVTDGDLKRFMGPDLLERKVSEIMTSDPKFITADSLAVQALDYMMNAFDQPISSLIVYDNETDKKLRGMIRLHDCLQAGIA